MRTSGKILMGIFAVSGIAGITALVSHKHRSAHSAVGVDAVPVRSSGLADRSATGGRWKSLTDPAIARDQRMEIACGIDRGLSQADADHLFSLLHHQPPAADRENWWLIVNEIMERMRRSGLGEDQYTRQLGAVISDPSANEVVRDYAIQHLGQWIAPAVSGGMPFEKDNVGRRQALETIAKAVEEPANQQTTIPGSGLLTLADAAERLDAELMQPVWEQLDPFLSDAIAGKTAVSHPTRTSAIQVAGRAGRLGHLPAVRSLAGDDRQPLFVRLSAIHALGAYRQPEDESLLVSLSASGAVQYAARAALAIHREARH